MPTEVFANGREICSKNADGKSAAAFPDMCWSPPAPPAGPVLVPYPNTAFARDLANGTTTVFIRGAMVARKDESYLSTSTGNEPATEQFPKGVATGALKGKAYFTSWSMDVMVEGLNVPRHLDLVTHNHASPGGNTLTQAYFDHLSPAVKDKCAKDFKKIEEECGAEPEKDKPSTSAARKSALKNLSKRLKNFKSKHDRKSKDGKNSWMDHCDGLWLKPHTNYSEQMKQFADQIGNIKGDLMNQVAEVVKPAVDQLEHALLDRIKREAEERALKLGVRSAARWGAGTAGAAFFGVGALVTETLATAWNVYDLASTAYEGYGLAKDAMKQIDQIKATMGDFDKALTELQGAWDKAKSNPQRAMAEAMSVLAALNSCTRARRCFLVPYKKTSTAASMTGEGCCPGQTGHHVLPDEMTKGGNCKGYKIGDAPTLCVEGTNNAHGSHGRIHELLTKRMSDVGQGKQISYEQARNIGINSVLATFPESMCDKPCLEAQLDDYYKSKCTGTVPALSGKKANAKNPADQESLD